MFRAKAVLLALAALVAIASAGGYDGYKIYEILPKTQKQTDFLYELSKMDEFYDFFTLRKMPNHFARVMVNPSIEKNFLKALTLHSLSFSIIDDDVGRSVEQEFQLNKLRRSLTTFTGKGRLSTDRFYSHGEISNYMKDLKKRFPSRVFLKTVGKSYEGRNITTITITNGDGRSNKNVIFIDGGFHAREWISPAAVLYVIEQLVENFKENAKLLLDYNFMILPVVNPDGYEYTQTSSKARFWRKTRQPYKSNKKVCFGADPNRNFDFHWNEEGASPDPCSELFAGSHGFSEPETKIVRDLFHSLKGRGVFYLTLHSYGNFLLYPWGWTYDLPDNWKDLDEVAKVAGDAIFNATGTIYTIGSSTNVLYIAAGGSDDYALNSGFNISITMELPDDSFNPPASSIDRMVKETWVGIRAMAERVIVKYSTGKY